MTNISNSWIKCLFQYVEPISFPLDLFLSLSVAVMAGCAQAKVRHGMLSASVLPWCNKNTF